MSLTDLLLIFAVCSMIMLLFPETVSILFGRSRSAEDVDLIIPKMPFDEFADFLKRMKSSGFERINTDNPGENSD